MANKVASKTLGSLLRERREELGYSQAKVADATRIRSEYIAALENDDYSLFASQVYAKGFLRNYAQYLGLDVEKVYAVYRRDTGKQSIKSSAKQQQRKDLNTQYTFNQKLAISATDFGSKLLTKRGLAITSVVLVFFLLAFFVFTTVNSLLSPPLLVLTSPIELTGDYAGEVKLAATSFQISGRTNPQTVVRLNADPLQLHAGNEFSSSEIPIGEGKTTVVITATNQFGRTSTIKLDVVRSNVTVENKDKLDVLIKVEKDITNMIVRSDGVIRFNDSAFPGDVIDVTAQKRLQIETETPGNVKVMINGKEYTFATKNQMWELDEGVVVQK